MLKGAERAGPRAERAVGEGWSQALEGGCRDRGGARASLEKWLEDTEASARARQGAAELRAAEPLIFNPGLGPLFYIYDIPSPRSQMGKDLPKVMEQDND